MIPEATPERPLIGRVLIRADASLRIGTGHVMRCLTLADALQRQGADVHFVCRRHEGHFGTRIRDRGFEVTLLEEGGAIPQSNAKTHADWLGISQSADAEATACIAREIAPDWLVVDHYAVDESWECELSRVVPRLMVIDDLADRSHRCTMLLDQGLGRSADNYRGLVAEETVLLLGPQYALLRPEFAEARSISLHRRARRDVRSILIALGGVDADNITGLVLLALERLVPPANVRVSVVLGCTAPWTAEIRKVAASHPWQIDVNVDPSSMAQLMSEADVAIGAAGATTWERCALGLPTILIPVAANQLPITAQLRDKGAVLLVDGPDDVLVSLPPMLESLMRDGAMRLRMAENASALCDGRGVARVIDQMCRLTAEVRGIG